MINTIQIKQAQLSNGFFTTGNGSVVIFIMGSCRVAPYVWYFEQLNELTGGQFTIHTLDPFNWNWDENDERVDYNEAIRKLETNVTMLAMLGTVDIFIHEYYQNAGMFNTNKENNSPTIYDFGLKPSVDLCIPNFNDYFILFGDIVNFDIDIRKRAIQDYNVIGKLSDSLQKEILALSNANRLKFYDVCKKSSFPSFASFFRHNFCKKRLFWTYNHVSTAFTFQIFMEILRVLEIPADKKLCETIAKEDLFANNFTHVTEYDKKWFHLKWDEEIKPLRERL